MEIGYSSTQVGEQSLKELAPTCYCYVFCTLIKRKEQVDDKQNGRLGRLILLTCP